MFSLHKRLLLSSMFFILTMLLLSTTKPAVLFTEKGTIKEFGIGDDKTIYSVGVFVVTMCVLIFYMFSMIDLMNN
jgi:hypothetical protein